MFENLDNDRIKTAIDDLINLVGIKESIYSSKIISLVIKNDINGCIKQITSMLGIPVDVNLSYIKSESDLNNFKTTDLVKTDCFGQGNESITAQVFIPPQLPQFGSDKLIGYPIKILISKNIIKYPDLFITIIAHELSHVLLKTLCSQHKDNELYTDLVPILLGFAEYIQNGRKITEEIGNNKTTITYGYLNDQHFEYACNYVGKRIKQYLSKKQELVDVLRKTKNQFSNLKTRYKKFRDYTFFIRNNPKKKMKREDTEHIVKLYGKGFISDIEDHISNTRVLINDIKRYISSINHYTNKTVNSIQNKIYLIRAKYKHLEILNKTVGEENKILKKYVSFYYKFKRIFLNNFLHKLNL